MFSAVEDFLNCSVCLCQLKNTHTTPCGHRYCEQCIKEWINRHRNCPCCNARLDSKHLVKDHQFDELIKKIDVEKASSEAKYFDNLIESAATDTCMETEQTENIGRKMRSPVELVLKNHLKDSLISHEKYYQELIQRAEKRESDIQAEYEAHRERIVGEGTAPQDMEERLESYKHERDEELKALKIDIERTTECITKAYDKYLKDHIPQLTILPIRVDIVLLSKMFTLRDVEIQAHDGITDIKGNICSELEKKGENVLGFDDNVKFFAFGPFSKWTAYEMFDMVRNIVDHGAAHPDIQCITPHSRPVMQGAMKPGSMIAVYGHVKYESDLPKQCFAMTFQKGQGQKTDYFSCKQCAINWVCRPCMEACHKGEPEPAVLLGMISVRDFDNNNITPTINYDHEVTPYIMGHQPTWACCYCQKKKKCQLIVT